MAFFVIFLLTNNPEKSWNFRWDSSQTNQLICKHFDIGEVLSSKNLEISNYWYFLILILICLEDYFGWHILFWF